MWPGFSYLSFIVWCRYIGQRDYWLAIWVWIVWLLCTGSVTWSNPQDMSRIHIQNPQPSTNCFISNCLRKGPKLCNKLLPFWSFHALQCSADRQFMHSQKKQLTPLYIFISVNFELDCQLRWWYTVEWVLQKHIILQCLVMFSGEGIIMAGHPKFCSHPSKIIQSFQSALAAHVGFFPILSCIFPLSIHTLYAFYSLVSCRAMFVH